MTVMHMLQEQPVLDLSQDILMLQMNVYDLFRMMATEVVTDIDEAEIVVSDENLSQRDGVEYIRSYNMERIISLMNS